MSEEARRRNGQPPVHQAPTPEQVAAVNAMREAQARAVFMQRREALSGIILNGICAGLYGRNDLPDNWGDRALSDAVRLADGLMERLAATAQAANDTSADRKA